MTIFIASPAGRMEALLRPSSLANPRWAAVVCHPHPKFGGTMHNKVVFHTAKFLNSQGLPTLRFNFRGVGLSQGSFDGGRGETDDVTAVLDYMAGCYPQCGLLVAGFSFGAWVGLRAACRDARVAAGIAIGLPFSLMDTTFLQTCSKPKLFLQGTEDPFSPMAEVERIYRGIGNPKKLVWILEADHFFEGQLPALGRALVESLRSQIFLGS
ncbi:MAG: alpha/beta hydrolase [Acidobacteria bacterium]|nr:alpha/beta hydrolase [Acidobacteriota bacterium]MBI3657554.1 alpha/beta hydrolase [Acidobacteriota bacterium]